MTEQSLYLLKYPIGEFSASEFISEDHLNSCVDYLESFPSILGNTISHLSNEQLDTPYRSGGWTIRQVVHHLPDSHVNAYVRMKLAATEHTPTITPYDEAAWAELEDGKNTDPKISINILAGVHHRLVSFARSLSSEQLEKSYYHPEDEEKVSIRKALCMYEWHSKHHLSHITNLIKKEGW